MAKPGAVSLSGIAQEVPISGTGPAQPYNAGAPSAVYASTFTTTLDSGGSPTAAQLTTLGQAVGFDTSKSDVVETAWVDPRLVSAWTPGPFSSKPVEAVFVNPIAAGLNYQVFGAWQYAQNAAVAPATTGAEGAASFGLVTPGSALPTSGQVKLSGLITAESLGEANEVDPGPTGYAALLTVNVDFGARSASLSSGPFVSDTIQYTEGNGVWNGTDLHGVLTYAAAQNNLTGTLTSSDGTLSGGATARFYGPSAQEIGGVFTLQSSAGGALVGAFGAGPTPASPIPDFSTWNAVGAPATVTLGGIGQEQPFSESGGLRTVGPVSNALAETLTETTDASGNMTFIQFQDANRTLTFDTATGLATISKAIQAPGFQYATDTAGDLALIADAKSQGWNYQTFGVWETLGNLSGTSVGTMSAGSVTPAAAIPSSGMATFNGQLGFIWSDTSWAAGLTIQVDFGAHTASLASDQIHAENVNSSNAIAPSTISGSLSWQSGQNALTGTVTASGPWTGLSGTATARFYGPAAQEIGGTFEIGPTGSATFVGAFGAAKSH